MLDLTFLIGISSLLFGLYKAFQVFSLTRKIRASGSWVVTRGIVTESGVKSNYWTSGRHFWSEIKYSYLPPGSECSGKLRNESFWKSDLSANDFIHEHPVGSALPVRYNPDKPGESITEYDVVSSYDRFIVIFYGVFGLVMLLMAILPGK
jgi:hypothetical protein